MWLLIGLGNPGPKYSKNRHNIGFMVIDELARRSRAESFRGKFGGELTTGELGGERCVLLKPLEYMNVSGRSVQRTSAFYQIDPKDIVVIHDEIDLPMGTLRVKVGGGHAGHNGLRSIVQDLGSAEFTRVRCGVGRPAGSRPVADFVLDDFSRADEEEAKILIQEAADAVEEIVRKGALLTMNKVNARKRPEVG
jgi:peptidyl-tRNA hydrolase, PTH1 family